MNYGKHRGHLMRFDGVEWKYDDFNTSVSDWPDRPCGHCGLANTAEGHDGCLGTLPNVMNACCGHGDVADAYVQYSRGMAVYGEEAVKIQNKLRKGIGD